mgnify:FL=1
MLLCVFKWLIPREILQVINDADVRKIVLSYLVHNCFKETAEAFVSSTGMKCNPDSLANLDTRKSEYLSFLFAFCIIAQFYLGTSKEVLSRCKLLYCFVLMWGNNKEHNVFYGRLYCSNIWKKHMKELNVIGNLTVGKNVMRSLYSYCFALICEKKCKEVFGSLYTVWIA